MFRRIWFSGLATLALLLLAPAAVRAQQGEHLYEWSGGWANTTLPSSGAGAFYGTPSYGSTIPSFVSVTPPYTYGFLGNDSQGYYLPEMGMMGDTTMNRPALINLSVPEGATVWFDDAKTQQTGQFRQFVSPPLAAGGEFAYDVKATWNQDGKEVTRTRHIPVHAGEVLNIALDAPAQQ
jgi:uncharacterized protein (TIGR03000 family)